MAEPIYIDEDIGRDDESAVGTETAPYKTLLHAMIQHPPESQAAKFLTRRSETGAVSQDQDSTERLQWKPATASALKKATKLFEQHKRKVAKASEVVIREQADAVKRQQVLEEAKKVIIEEDKSLPKAMKIQTDDQSPLIKLGSETQQGTRVRVLGRVHHLRSQKETIFVTLKDGYGKMQCVLSGPLIKTYAAMTLALETTIDIRGELRSLPPGAHAPLDRELQADYFVVIGTAPGGGEAITNKVQEGGDPQTLLDNRHLVLRGDNISSVMKVRATVEGAFQQAFKEERFRKVSPPAMVQGQVEGGSTLFTIPYFEDVAYLTQSSQLYLETCIASMGNVYCIEKSFRAEKSLTRRHLSEYTHIEAELDFITFDDLLDHLERIICRVLDITFAEPETAGYIKQLNPDFKPLARPFKRMRYSEAIKWLIENNVPNGEGQPHQIGDDIEEAAERRMVDTLNVPVFLTHFPVEIKAFYMKKDPEDLAVTESADLLLPSVGEIVGGSMRMDDYDELMTAYKREGIDPSKYVYYTDQRKYGTSPHGGYGLGLERFIAYLCNQYTVRSCALYPRYFGRCAP